MSWIRGKEDLKKNSMPDLMAIASELARIATGATMLYMPVETHNAEGKKRLGATIDKIHALIEADYPEFNEKQRRGTALVLASTWTISFLLQIAKEAEEMKKEGLL